jgi:hypothetical protein
MSGFAFAVFAPLTHKWYGALEKRFPGTSTKAVLQRVALDQTGYAFFILSTLFTTMSLLEGKSAEQAAEKWRSAIGPTMKVNWAIWFALRVVELKRELAEADCRFAQACGATRQYEVRSSGASRARCERRQRTCACTCASLVPCFFPLLTFSCFGAHLAFCVAASMDDVPRYSSSQGRAELCGHERLHRAQLWTLRQAVSVA